MAHIYLASPHMSAEGYEQQYVKEAFDTNWIAPLGKNVNEFEKEFSAYVGAHDGAALSAGTAAIHMALKAAGVKKGDIVFCQDLTFSATANPIIYEDAVPVFIDSDYETWNMSPEALERAFEKTANVVVCVSEGIADAGGTFICEYSDAAKLDSFGHKMLTGCGEVLESFVRDRFHVKVRSIELNVSQRCSGMLASRTDIEESAMAGAFGVRAALSGETGKMAAFQRTSDAPYKLSCCLEPVGRICNQEKKFPAEWISQGGSDVTDSFLPYILPLIQGEPERIMENGLPRYLYRQPDAAARIKP